MGPKTVALLWDATKISNINELAEAIDAGRLNGLPRMDTKQIEKLRKGIDDYRRSAGQFRIDVADEEARRIAAYLMAFEGLIGYDSRGFRFDGGGRPAAILICWRPGLHVRRKRQGRRWSMWRNTRALWT